MKSPEKMVDLSSLAEQSRLSCADYFRSLPTEEKRKRIDALSDAEALALQYDWSWWSRAEQRAPVGDWTYWLILAGRGFGKTRAGAEWVRSSIKTSKYVNLIGATADDARDIMIEGEALAIDTPIATPSGWATLGELAVGDQVFAADGTPTRIVALSSIWTDRRCLSICSDGADPIVADERHKWVTTSRAERRPWLDARRQSIKSTNEIAASLHENDRHDLVNHEFPMHGALVLPDAALPVPPYTLGAWLGDGDTRGHGTFTCHERDTEIIDRIREDGFEVNRLGGRYDWGIRKLRAGLRIAGLIGNKEIPAAYLRASIEQRLALLRGLMDTDGYVSARGQCSFDNTNERMVRDVRDLLLTLGFKPGAVQEKPDARGHKTMYRVAFMRSVGSFVPFILPRKADRCIAGRRPAGRLVRAADEVDSVPTRCIQVEHESGTFLAGRDLVVTHNSGILAICPKDERPEYKKYERKLLWPNGSTSLIFTAEEPERLRGKQHEKLWLDELGSWRYADSFDQAKFGLRLGLNPQAVITTTPRPTKIIKEIIADPSTIVTRGSTYDNANNLAVSFFNSVIRKYEGTRLGRQELDAEVLADNPGALWNLSQIDKLRVKDHPPLKRIVVGVDPSVTSGEEADEAGIVIAGVGVDEEYYILDDLSMVASPDSWARAAVRAYHDRQADRIIAETNNGGDMVELVIRTVDANVSYKKVTASRGKMTRAEPIAALYEQGRVHHVGIFPKLEDQMTEYDPLTSKKSPDRMDALVWAMTELSDASDTGIIEYYKGLHAEKTASEDQNTSSFNTRSTKNTSSLQLIQLQAPPGVSNCYLIDGTHLVVNAGKISTTEAHAKYLYAQGFKRIEQ